NLGLQKNEFLIRKMREAGFSAVFLGIETPDPATLRGMNKKQNLQVDLVETVRKIQAMGIEVYAGFIYGSDEDTRAAAQTIIDFVEQVPIFSAMTGMLTPVPHTPLYEQLREEGRLLPAEFTGNNVDDAIQLIPKNMSVEEMREGFHSILTTLFTAKHAYGRALRVLEQIQPHIFSGKNLIPYIQAAFLSLWEQGIKRRDWEYFKLLWEAWKLDRKAYHAAEQEQTALKQLWGPEGTYAQQQPPWNETARASFEKIVGYARDYWIRFQPEKTLEEIRAYAGKLEQDVGAARTVPPADVQAVYCAAGEFLEARKKQFSFPGAYLPLAFNLAIKALHYENVMKATVGKSPEQIAICYGKSAEENIIPKVAVG
ncbi:DUF4070 domain-containing protein, partial [Candidatus Woesearchaeota archaeon]|nr:DUF4070 domain-containing protein [Candidatus Woesearchaeota archaeon]